MKNVAAQTRIARALARLDAARREYQDAIAAAPDGDDHVLVLDIENVTATAEGDLGDYRVSCEIVLSKTVFPDLVGELGAWERLLATPRVRSVDEKAKVRRGILLAIRDHLDGLGEGLA